MELGETALGNPTGTADPVRWWTRGSSTDRQPVYSPDGRWVLFSSNRSGNLDLWRVSSESGVLQRLTDDPADDWDPAVLPDGSILWSSNRQGVFQIWRAREDGTSPRPLTNDPTLAENPSAGGGEPWVVYNSRDPDGAGVWRMRPDGSEASLLIPGDTRLPEVSPDGRWLLYLVQIRFNRLSLKVASLEDGSFSGWQIDVASPGGRARWRPDGSGIVFGAAGADGRLGLRTADFDPSTAGPVQARPLAVDLDDASVETFGLSPDGRRLAFAVRRDAESRLMLAEPAD